MQRVCSEFESLGAGAVLYCAAAAAGLWYTQDAGPKAMALLTISGVLFYCAATPASRLQHRCTHAAIDVQSLL